jgi:hypothetical protein
MTWKETTSKGLYNPGLIMKYSIITRKEHITNYTAAKAPPPRKKHSLSLLLATKPLYR